ncbi:uncharacterized protein LOC119646882 isoform X2 [Hermetia illucens]|uniref:uncharacterized protein LOC119646882 isoform X2 n=1 Tax=Hermetia illucens TaxID=343691 RepID=UPI0018CC266D|nr:uncharacterized protein LOC119646882 isoform X2 [Hermetia illucens]
MGPLKRAFVCLLILIPLANSEQKGQKSPRDVGLISGKIMSFTGAGQHDLRANIPGEPGVDYPIYSSPPDTSFSCLNRHEGYYADVETRCQVFRICSHTDHTGKGFAFLCPNGTLFSQHDFVCDWYRNVPCESSPNYYFMNELLDKSVSPHPELLMKDVVAMVNYPMKVMKQQEIFKKILPQPPRIVSTTPRPAPISFPTQPQNFRKPPTLVQPVIPPVRNPFQTETKQPDPKLFEPVTDLPHVQQPQPLQPQFENVPHSQNIEQPRQELFTPAPPTIPPTAPELTQPIPENQQAINHYDPSKVYISSLGELSTDPGSNFDPSTAIIIPDKSQEQSPIFTQAGNQEHLLQGKLEPIQSQANKNLLLNLENIASSIPGNINSQLALIRDQPLSEGEVVQIPGTLHVSLNYTQRINTALKNVLIPSTAQDQIAINPLLSGDGKLVSEIYGQNQLQDNNGILKFAHNINSAFQVNNPALGDGQSQQAIEPKDLLNSKGIGSTGKGFGFTSIDTPYGPDGKIKPQQYPTAPGPQTLQGIGFSKSNIAVSTPASVLHTQTIYIPSINLKQNPSSEKTTDETATAQSPLLLDQIPVTIQNLLSNDDLDRDQLTAANQHYGSDSGHNRQNGLEDKNHAKRAENLLLKGVQLSLYDTAYDQNLTPFDNHIDITTPYSTERTAVSTTTFGKTDLKDQDDINGPFKISINTEDISRSLPAPTPEYGISSTIDPLYLRDSSGSPLLDELAPNPKGDLATKGHTTETQLTIETSTLSILSSTIPTESSATLIETATATPSNSGLPDATAVAPTDVTTTETDQPQPFKLKNRYFTRARKIRPGLTTTSTTEPTLKLENTNQTTFDSTTTEVTNLYGIRAALSKTRNKVKKVRIFKRPKLTFIEDTNHPQIVKNLSKLKYTSTITSSNTSTSSASNSTSSNNNINNTVDNINSSIKENSSIGATSND